MCRKVSLFVVLGLLPGLVFAETYRCQDANGYFEYSAKPCDSDEDASGTRTQPEIAPSSSTDRSAVYAKDMVPLASPDAATQACFNFVNTTALFPDPSTTRLLSSAKKWVTIKDVGGRQMVSIGVTSKNEAGMYVGIHRFDCLMMGDNVTVNTDPYELM